MSDLTHLQNFFKLQICVREATKWCQHIFTVRWMQLFNNNWNNSPVDAAYFETDTKGQLIKNQVANKGNKFKLNLERGNSAEWDLTLLGTILIMSPFKNGKNVHIQKLNEFRNVISHIADMSISDEKYNELYNKFSLAMKSLGYSEDALVNFKQKLDSSTFESTTNINKNVEFQNAMKLADEELKKQNFLKAIELYNVISPQDLSNDDLCELFYNRSLAYSKMYDSSNMPDEKHIYRALSDAENICLYHPSWPKGYSRTGEVYLTLNDLDKSREYFEKALALDCGNVEWKNSLAFVKQRQGEKSRQENLNAHYFPYTTEQVFDKYSQKFRENNGTSLKVSHDEDIFKEFIQAIDPNILDVFKGH